MKTICAVTLEESPQPEDIQCVKGKLANYTIEKSGLGKTKKIVLLAKNAENAVIAALLGFTFGGWFHMETLWVDEAVRGKGLGKNLVRRAEEEAVARGCRIVNVETFSFQAPEFYRKLNYEQLGEADDIGNNHKIIFFRKNLV